VKTIRAEMVKVLKLPKEQRKDPDKLMHLMPNVVKYAEKQEAVYSQSKDPTGMKSYWDKSPVNVAAHRVVLSMPSVTDDPGSGGRKEVIRKIFTRSREIMKSHGVDLNAVDFQAVLWYYEKRLYSKVGKTDERSKPWDYAQAAKFGVGVELGRVVGSKPKRTKRVGESTEGSSKLGGRDTARGHRLGSGDGSDGQTRGQESTDLIEKFNSSQARVPKGYPSSAPLVIDGKEYHSGEWAQGVSMDRMKQAVKDLPKNKAGAEPPTDIEAGLLLKQIDLKDGYSYQPIDKTNPIKGFSVSVAREAEESYPEGEVTKQHIIDFITKNADRFSDESLHAGAWRDGGKIYFDLSRVMKTQEEAEKVAIENDQLAVFDLANVATVYVQSERTKREKGTGNEETSGNTRQAEGYDAGGNRRIRDADVGGDSGDVGRTGGPTGDGRRGGDRGRRGRRGRRGELIEQADLSPYQRRLLEEWRGYP